MPACDYPSSSTWLQPSLWDCQHSDHLKPAGELLKKQAEGSIGQCPECFFCVILGLQPRAFCMQSERWATLLYL